ncbi:NAD(P)/FAD-dependent oxidoreductase [Paraburkholderia fungorum]|uniref:NAD(P)-binding domain-containing protein n=1 Tax=Paraburkholderia fungorum TaxID=134537 RepID=UPI0038B72EFC
MSPPPRSLSELEARLKQDLAWLGLPPKPWVPERMLDGTRVIDVLVVGGGMCGLAAATALKLLGINNVKVIDRGRRGAEGPWSTFARMETLRSPKDLTGPALGLPALTFRAWFESQFGQLAWERLDKIPTLMWMDYLRWYRTILGIAIDNDVKLARVEPRQDGLVDAYLTHAQGTGRIVTRRLILATGRDGLGAPYLPSCADGIERRYYAHSADQIDFGALAGKRVAVVGAGASAMDNAATALEAGAHRVDLFIRREDIPRVNKLTGIGSPGLEHGFAALPDAWKWRVNAYSAKTQIPPPRGSTLRVSRHSNAFFHLGSPVKTLTVESDSLVVQTPKGRYQTDFIIFATGFSIDITRRPELASFASQIRLWQERSTPPDNERTGDLGLAPDLGPLFEFRERHPGACPALSRIHCFNSAALMSHGRLSGDIPGVSVGARRLAEGIATQLFVEDIDSHYTALLDYESPELHGDEWMDGDIEVDTGNPQEADSTGR